MTEVAGNQNSRSFRSSPENPSLGTQLSILTQSQQASQVEPYLSTAKQDCM